MAESVAAPSRSFFAVGTSFGGVQLWDFDGANAEHAAAVFSLGGKKSTSGTSASARARVVSARRVWRRARLTGESPCGSATPPTWNQRRAKRVDSPTRRRKTSYSYPRTSWRSPVPPVRRRRRRPGVALWDALQPARANPGVIRAHAGRCTALAQLSSLTVPYGVPWPFLTGGHGGGVAAHDLRMLGGAAAATVWRAPPRRDAPSPPSPPFTAKSTLRRHRRSLRRSPRQRRPRRLVRVQRAAVARKFLTPRGGGAFASLGVSQILPLHDGVLTAGGTASSDVSASPNRVSRGASPPSIHPHPATSPIDQSRSRDSPTSHSVPTTRSSHLDGRHVRGDDGREDGHGVLAHRRYELPQVRQRVRRGGATEPQGTAPDAGARGDARTIQSIDRSIGRVRARDARTTTDGERRATRRKRERRYITR